MSQSNNGRDQILGAIRRALRVPAPMPGHHGPQDGAPIDGPATTPASPERVFLPVVAVNGQPQSAAREWLPKVGESWDEQAELFAKNSADLKADFQVLANREALPDAIKQLAQAENWSNIAAHDGELVNLALENLEIPIFVVESGYSALDLEKCPVGITQCDALIAQTGTVLVTSQSAGGRVLSILPPHHIVVATRDQMVPDLPAAFALLREKYGENYPSMISFITGPSRTGDIERILVLGAHGPKKLTILCV